LGPELIGWTDRNGTRWKISAIPLGGYVKFLGDSDAASATHEEGAALPADMKRHAFFTQPLYARAAVVLGGPAANLIFAVALLTGVFYVAGEPYSPPTVGVQANGRRRTRACARVTRSSTCSVNTSTASRISRTSSSSIRPRPASRIPAQRQAAERRDRASVLRAHGQVSKCRPLQRPWHGPADPAGGGGFIPQPGRGGGLKVGDVLKEIDGKSVVHFTHIPELIGDKAGKPITITYNRDGRDYTTSVRGPSRTRSRTATARNGSSAGCASSRQQSPSSAATTCWARWCGRCATSGA
jgi:regulator of sigma E protease